MSAPGDRAKLEALLEEGSLPSSRCTRQFLQLVQPLIAGGVLLYRRAGAGRALAVQNVAALREFIRRRYPEADGADLASPRIIGVAQFRDSKVLGPDPARMISLRGWNDHAIRRNREPVKIAAATKENGVFAFLLEERSEFTLHGRCALVENPAALIHFERLGLKADLVIYGGGRISRSTVKWLGSMDDPSFRLIHLPDYDPVGLSEFIRLREALGERVQLHLPEDLAARFERMSNPALLRRSRSQALLANVRRSTLQSVRAVVDLIEKHNAGLEQEALFIS
jgi:hypothetical protein